MVSRSIRIGGDEMDQDIVNFARREYNLLMGERTAEEIKIAVGSAYPDLDPRTVTFRGRDLLTGRSVEELDQIREAVEPSVAAIIQAIRDTIEETPPELVADIMDQGSCWPVAAPCWPDSTGGWRRRPRCRSTSPTIR